MNLVVWKNYLEGPILYRSLVPPIKNGVKGITKEKNGIFTIRKRATPIQSASGEMSWIYQP